MAVHVVPYSPWREQLAAGIIAPLIGDFLTNMRQNEQNRKTNSFRGALQDALSSQSQQVSLTPQNVPDGYNSDPWANAFHKSDSPLTQFDLGTSSLTPRTPSIQDIAQAANTLAASKRFSMMNPETVDKIRNQQMQRAYADMFGNAQDAGAQMRALAMGTAEGVVPHQALAAFTPWAVHRTPHMTSSNIDAGSSIDTLSIDPLTGNVVSRYSTPKGISPADAARNATTERVATIGANASMHNSDAATGLGYSQLAQTREENRRKEINDQITALETRRQAILNGDFTLEQKNAMIAPINEEIARLRSSLTGGYQQDNPQWTIGEAFIGGANKGRITGGYLEQRPGHKHQGVDLPVDIGTPVTLRQVAGEGFSVSHVGNEPGYGTFVDIEGTRGGHKVKYRFAHLTPGSVRFKSGQPVNVGDIIAHTGNSGRSTGPHLHIEAWIDGKKVNPHTMLQDFPLQSASSQNTPKPAQDAPQQLSQALSHNDPALYKNENGEVITQSQFDELVRKSPNLGPAGIQKQLNDKGFLKINNDSYSFAKLDPAQDFRPGYMRLPQEQAFGPGDKHRPTYEPDLPLFNGSFSDFLRSFDLASGDNSAIIPNISTFNPTPYDPRYSGSPRAGYNIVGLGQGYLPTPGEFPDYFLDKNRRNSIPRFDSGYRRAEVDNIPWSFADFINSIRQHNENSPDKAVLSQRYLNNPAFPNSFIGLDSSLYWPQVMEFPIRAYPYR